MGAKLSSCVTCLFLVRIIEDDEGAIAAQLQGHFLDSLGAVARDDAAHSGGSCERDFVNQRMLA